MRGICSKRLDIQIDRRYKTRRCYFQAFKRESNGVLATEWQLIRRCTLYLVLSASLVGLWLCLAADPAAKHHGPGSPSTAIHAAEDCRTLVSVRGEESGSRAPLPSSLLAMEQNTTYEDIRLTPPSPPPRG